MAQPQCFYHPDKRGTASCPNCNERICDQCRLQGNSQRCGTCQSVFQKGGEQPGGQRQRVQCTNHAGVPTDTRCQHCRKPYCAACLNGQNKCFNCALAAPKETGPKPRGAKKGTGKPPAKATGKLKAAPKKAPPWPLIGGAVTAVAVLGLAMTLMKPAKPPKPYQVTGPMEVAIVAPAGAGTLKGPQVIKLKVASHQHLDRVELTVNGKYWDKIKQPPFESDWPTSLLPNGPHTIEAKAVYKNKRSVSAKKIVHTRN